MALVGEARARRDFSQTASTIANQLDGTLQSQMHNVTVRTDANGPSEDAGEVERAAPRYLRA